MKATMNSTGVITLMPESGVEVFALKCWTDRAEVRVADPVRDESSYWRASMLIVIPYAGPTPEAK